MYKPAFDHSLQFIDSWLGLRYEYEEIPGYVVAIAHKGKLVFHKAYGYADLTKQTKLTPESIFRIASHSKTFTATALMQLQEQGKLRIDDYAINYLPWLKSHVDRRWQKVTLRQLMSHGAGVIRDGLDSDYWQLERPFPNVEQLKQEVLEAKLVLDTNVKLKYSNFGYSLLGLAIEAVSGQSYHEYVTEHIVHKLGLKHTGPETNRTVKDSFVVGYGPREGKTRLPIDDIDTHAMAAATGFYATAEDLCTYFSAHMVGSKKLLSDESKREMQRVQYHAFLPGEHIHEDYGLGLEIEQYKDHKLFGHSGGFPGHSTISMVSPKEELVIVVLTNCIDGPAAQIAKGVLNVIDYFQKNTPTTKPKHNLVHLEGCYMNLWGMSNIVVTGDKVVAAYPNSWHTLTLPEELEYVDDTTFKIAETSSFNSEGELVQFHLKNGKVESVIYSGATMWPEAVWKQKQAARKIVKLPN